LPGVDFTVTRSQPTAGATTISAPVVTTPASGTATMRKASELVIDYKSDAVPAGAKLLAEITAKSYPGTVANTPVTTTTLKTLHNKTMRQFITDANA
jgi:hypothetical protein